jgi:predicted ATPase/DNA-binding SARP family transcriptional activator
VEALFESLWGDALPRAPLKALQTYVLRVRNALEPDRGKAPRLVVTEGGGYRLVVSREAVDAHQFADHVEQGRRDFAAGRVESSVEALRAAAQLWRGPAYVGFELTSFGAAEARRLHEMRAACEEHRWTAELAVGNAAATVPELERLLEVHPFRERLWGLLMQALYQLDRQGDALAAYQRARSTLADTLGVDPGRELQNLHAQVLAHDPALHPVVRRQWPSLDRRDGPLLGRSQPKIARASSVLPRPGTPLVGRDGELAELAALLSSPQVRLVTLTGPGGIGKTRLAIAVAENLIGRFPDGVHFVPLAAAAAADVMWTTLAETLEVPPGGRLPPGLFDYVSPLNALFVLDNLEQIPSADSVVAELLCHAPQAVVIATSRRSLNVPGEQQYAVPPLELPVDTTLEEAQNAGAVQLFVQQARAVKASFALTDANAADAVLLCRRLDGLPLAVELAAARTKLLSPAALLARVDKALEITAAGSQRPSRQRTLRETIAWSYRLLNPTQQALFSRLGVFVGGADIAAVTAVSADVLGDADALDFIADLVDASLATVTDDDQGEPRIGMLQTIRAYALDQLQATGHSERARQLHAEHYRRQAELLRSRLHGAQDERLASRRRFELEHDNFRQALRWALSTASKPETDRQDRVTLGLEMCENLAELWASGGYYPEARRWFEQATSLVTGNLSLARALSTLAIISLNTGETDRARAAGVQAVTICRRLGDKRHLTKALIRLAICEEQIGNLPAARQALAEARTLADELGDDEALALALMNLGHIEVTTGHYERALELTLAAQDITVQLADAHKTLLVRVNVIDLLRRLGRLSEARKEAHRIIPSVLSVSEPAVAVLTAEDYAVLLTALGEHSRAVRLFAAAKATRERIGTPRDPLQEATCQEATVQTRAALPPLVWEDERQAGHIMTIEDALTEAHAATTDLAG